MKNRLTPMALGLFLSGFVAMPALAAVSDADQSKIAQLEAQLASMQKEVRALKTSGKHVKVRHMAALNPVTTTAPPVSSTTNSRTLRQMINEEREYLPFDLDVPGQAFVSTGPYVGVPLQFAGNNLIVNSPSVNTDVQLLNIRKKISEQLHMMGGEIAKEPYHSHLLLSGVVEAQANYINRGGAPSTTDINVTNVSLDSIFLGPSNWTLGFVELSYDDTTPANSVFTSVQNYRTANSRIFVNKAFITIGDFSKSAIYGSVGQFYVPFGTYSSTMISNPLTKILTRTKARSILFGFQQQNKNAFYGSAYIFRGDSHANSVPKVNNGGLNLGYKFDAGIVTGNFGGGVIANIADSGGMQFGNAFSTTEQIVHRVPGYNARGYFSFGQHYDIILEYVGASTQFNTNDMSFNHHGAKPSAFDIEGDYSFTIFGDKPSSIGLAYSKSNEALSLGIPLKRYALTLNLSYWRNTLQSLEFSCDRQYAANDVATGAGGSAASSEMGKVSKAVIAKFDYYF